MTTHVEERSTPPHQWPILPRRWELSWRDTCKINIDEKTPYNDNLISVASDGHLPGPSSSLRLLPANNSSFFTMFAFTCVPSITLTTISLNLLKCLLDTEWFLFIYHTYIVVYHILFNFIQLPPWYRVAPIDFGRRKLAKTELTPHPKRKLVTFALHQHFVFTVDKIAALLKIKLIALLNAFHWELDCLRDMFDGKLLRNKIWISHGHRWNLDTKTN